MLIYELVSVLPYIAAEIHRAGLRSPKRIRVHVGRWWQLLRVRLQLWTASAHAQNMYMDASIIIPKTHSQGHDALNLKLNSRAICGAFATVVAPRIQSPTVCPLSCALPLERVW